MDLGIKGKTALVCGASTGLGFAAAMVLAKEGVRVAINSRSQENLNKAAKSIAEQTGERPAMAIGDLSIDGMAEQVVETVHSVLGKIDILVANAGGPPPGQFLTHSKETWQKSIGLTLLSNINLARAVIPEMKQTGWGRIIFITSVAVKQPVDNLIISNSLRAGVTGFAKTLANELASSGITVNTVCPGYTDTERLKGLFNNESSSREVSIDQVRQEWMQKIPVKRLGRPDELASLITFLASDRAGYITGTSIQVDGGLYKGLL
jgi:3-oxoacyl-[acyl-carrier protein] reductase